jgi:hypothetical protein
MSGGQLCKLAENSRNSGELNKEVQGSSPTFQSGKSANAPPDPQKGSAAQGVGVLHGAINAHEKARQNLRLRKYDDSRAGATEKLIPGEVSKSDAATLIASRSIKMPDRHFDSAAASSTANLTEWAQTVRLPSIVAQRVLVAIAGRSDERGEAQISIGTLAHLAGTSAQTTGKNLKRLEALGVLTVAVTRRADGGQDAHRFKLTAARSANLPNGSSAKEPSNDGGEQ